MPKLHIIGGQALRGEIRISGAKNAALPLMAAGLLTDDVLQLSNVPDLADIRTMAALLIQHGAMVEADAHGAMRLSGALVNQLTAPYELVRTMRASVLVLGPLLARFGAVKVSLPGGCAIGTRPIDLHLRALEQMGAVIELNEGYVHAHVDGRLKGAEIQFEKVSVGATENLLMAASLAEGQTVLHNAAREPEVQDLAHCLVRMGAQISGIGTTKLVIDGVERLHEAKHEVVFDRIEAGSFACAAAATGGSVQLLGARVELMQAVVDKLLEAGVEVEETARGMRVACDKNQLRGVDITTQPYSGFPTDMQAQWIALMSVAQGASLVTETIFENRFMHVPELHRMGANITMQGHTALVRGVQALHGAPVMATDLRASFSLVIAALAAQGETTIDRIYHLDRGYEQLEAKLAACGANIERVANKDAARMEEADVPSEVAA